MFLSPDRRPDFKPVPAATNHQLDDDWPDYARAVRTVEREQYRVETFTKDRRAA